MWGRHIYPRALAELTSSLGTRRSEQAALPNAVLTGSPTAATVQTPGALGPSSDSGVQGTELGGIRQDPNGAGWIQEGCSLRKAHH